MYALRTDSADRRVPETLSAAGSGSVIKDAIASPRIIKGVKWRLKSKMVKQIALRTLQTMTIMSTCGRISTVHCGCTGCARQYEMLNGSALSPTVKLQVDAWLIWVRILQLLCPSHTHSQVRTS